MPAPGRMPSDLPPRLGRALRSFRDDQRGAVAIIAGTVIIMVMGFAALGIDVGKIFADRRAAQSAADLAAIAAASDLPQARRAATATLQQNRYSANAMADLVTGIYKPDPVVPAAERFRPAPLAQSNAAQVLVRTSTPLIFGRILSGTDSFTIETRATAAQTAFASFAIGSGLVTLNDGLLNHTLGALLGTNLSLSLMDYRALLDARLDLFTFSRALASRAGLTAGTYQNIAAAEVKVADVVGAMLDTAQAGANQQAALALNAVLGAVRNSAARIRLSALVDFGPYAGTRTSETPQIGVAVAALDLLSAVAQLANGQRQVEVALGVSLPGLLGASLRLAIGERPQGTSWLAIGETGTSVHTAQTRLLFTARIGGSGSITSVTLPIYVELASATATLNQISCTSVTDRAAIAVTPAVLDGWIGDVGPADFVNFRTTPRPGRATLVQLPLVRVKGLAHATISNIAPRTLIFSAQDIAQQTKKNISTSDFTASLLSRLIGDLELDAELLGIGLGLPLDAVQKLVAKIVEGAASPLDGALSNVLATLGIRLGQADVWMTGLRCDGAVLVR